MKEIGEMDMPAFLRLRAWAVARQQEKNRFLRASPPESPFPALCAILT